MKRVDLLDINEFSRPGNKLKSVNKLVLHWVANPKTTAQQNRNFFNNRKMGLSGYGSAHYICDDNEIIQCIPTDEIAYHVGATEYTDFGLSISSYPNARTLGIEFCHDDWRGKPNQKTYTNILDICEYLCKKFNLDPKEDICTHNSITGKDCPKFYIEVPSEFYRLKSDVSIRLSL